MRKFIRHPAGAPIEVMTTDKNRQEFNSIRNISCYGLCFDSGNQLEVGTNLIVTISLIPPAASAKARVVWCHKSKDHYNVGVELLDPKEAFPIRMMEQLCHIEQYRQNAEENEGRKLTSAEAADEWIEKYAKDFPPL